MPIRAEDSNFHRLYRGGVAGVDDDPATVSIRRIFSIIFQYYFGKDSMSLNEICECIHWLNAQVEEGPELFTILDEYSVLRVKERTGESIPYTDIPAVCFEARVLVGERVETRIYVVTLCEFEITRLGLDFVYHCESVDSAQPQPLTQAAQSGGD